jgi:hypothetical protein
MSKDEIYLLSKEGGRGDFEGLQEIMICGQIGLINKHASIEVERGLRTHLSRPLDLIRTLLAVTNLVLRAVAPCFLTEAVHHSIEATIRHVKEVVYVVKYLDVPVQIYHLAILHKL